MEDLQMAKISRCLDLNVFLLKVSAAWPGDISASPWKNSLYKCCKIFLGSVVTFCTLGMMLYCFNSYDSLEHVIENAIVLIEMVNLAGRAVAFNVHKKTFYWLIESLPRNFFVHTEYHTDFMHITSAMSTINYVRTITLSMPVLYAATSGFMALHPLITLFEENVHNSNQSAQMNLPFKTWYPYFKEDNSYYEIQYVFQMISAIFVSTYFAAMDTLSIALLAYVACQFQLLSDTLRNMSDNVMLKSKNDDSNRNSSSEKLEESGKKICAIEKGPISRMENVPLTEVQGNLVRCEDGDENDTACSINSVLGEIINDSAQQNIDAEMLQYLKACIRHHQLLLE
jgi:hypothetical protein